MHYLTVSTVMQSSPDSQHPSPRRQISSQGTAQKIYAKMHILTLSLMGSYKDQMVNETSMH